MSLQKVPAGRNFPDDINVIIEVPMNSPAIKYEAGEDSKIIAVPVSDVTGMYRHVTSVDDLDDILLDQIVHFFEHYKDLERNKWVKTGGWKGVDVARQELIDSVNRYQSASEKPDF